MISMAFFLVLFSGITHAVWNLFTKRSLNKYVFLWSIHIVGTLALLPYFIIELLRVELHAETLCYMAISALFQGSYFIFLSKSYSYGDLSQTYPIMRGTGVMLVTLLSVVLFGDSLTLVGWIGFCCIIVGLFIISGIVNRHANQGKTTHSISILYAIVVGMCVAGYTLMDKLIVQQLSPLSTLELSNINYVIVAFFMVIRAGRAQIIREWQQNWKMILIGCICSPASYFMFLMAMKLAPLASIAPIREIGTVVGTILGILVLKEKQGVRRIIMSAVITCGIISIAIWG
ncbi:SMR family transporter [Paenibacillus sp. FSL F4-0236]|uniref:DMT family transporter n=1 Tax=Paenibacillus sp. FSL F4-0236 TaxID=2954731 RepID=UPI0030F8D63A